jgi:hypothetical protein
MTMIAAGFAAGHLNLTRQFHGSFDDFGTTAKIKEARLIQWHNLGQGVGVGFDGFAGEHGGVDIGGVLGLLAHGFDDFGTAVSHIHHQRPARTVNVTFAIFVIKINALPMRNFGSGVIHLAVKHVALWMGISRSHCIGNPF